MSLTVNPLKRRVIGFARSASRHGNGIDAQITAIKAYAKSTGVDLVDVLVQPDGPSRISEQTIQKLCERKRQQNDFDALVVTNPDRLTRNWFAEWPSILISLMSIRIGIEVVSEAATQKRNK